MYIYFDENGTIKEVVNDKSIRQGSNEANKLYCYIEGNPSIDDIWYLQKNVDGSLTNEISFKNSTVTKAIPYDAKRDMRYFKDFETYTFYVFTLTTNYLKQSGLVSGTIRIEVDNEIFALGELKFNVQENVINTSNGITQSQYDYLLLAYASRTLNEQTGSDLDHLLDEKIEAKLGDIADGSPRVFDTTAHIQALTSDMGVAVATDTGYIWVWNDTDEEYKNTNYVYLANVSAYYTKTETDTLLNGKADKTDTYTKSEVYNKTETDNLLDLKADKSTTYTKTEINNYKKMWDNLVYSCGFTIDDSAKTMTISGSWAFTKYSFIVIDNIAVKTISYASLSLGNYCLVIRNNALEFVNFANAIQDGDMVLWIGFLNGTGDIRTDIYRCNNKVTNLALGCSKNIKIDTINKNFVIPNGFLFWNSGYASITAQNISYEDSLNATCVLVYRNGVFKVLLLQNIELFYNDVIVAVVWFRNDGFVLRKVYVVNETPDKAFTELPLSSKIFMRVGVIGDSYTSGWIKDNAHKNNPNYSWVKYMKQLTGNEWTNFGVSGSSTKSWVDGTLGQLPQVQTKGNKCQAYVIGLMINDQSTGAQTYVPLGTSSDIGTNENSYYAYYYKLINACLSVNSSAIIFCNTCPRTDGNFPSYNQAVVDVVSYCQNENKNVYLVELRNYVWSNETFTNDALNGHYTAIGYEYMAEIFNKAFSDTINANSSSLKEINLIPYDSATVYDYVDKKINDLRWELGSHTLDVESDTDTLFSKSVPSGALGCQINKVGGMSYKSENLLQLSDVAETTTNGITYKVENGVITLNGTATTGFDLRFFYASIDFLGDYGMALFFNKNVTFTSVGIIAYNKFTAIENTNYYGGTKNYSSSYTANYGFIRFVEGDVVNNVTMKLMIIKGTTAPTVYKQGFTGIRDSAVTSVVSRKVGLNSLRLTQIGAIDLGSLTWFYQSNNTLFACYSHDTTIPLPKQNGYQINDKGYETGNPWGSSTNNILITFINDDYFSIAIRDTSYTDATQFKNSLSGVKLYYELETELATPQQAVLDYFVKDTLNISNEIQALTGYGWGVNDTCYNYIDFDRKVFVQKVGRVNLGTLNYGYRTDYTNPTFTSDSLQSIIKANGIGLCSLYVQGNNANFTALNNMEFAIRSDFAYLYIVNTNYTTVEAFKTAMSGVYLYYELETPIETDISEYLTTDTIDVEGGGSIEFTNTYSQAVPSDIDYLIEEVKA